MALTHNLRFPRIGTRRELKFALEDYWKQKTTADDLLNTAKHLRQQNWQTQADLDYAPVGTFPVRPCPGHELHPEPSTGAGSGT